MHYSYGKRRYVAKRNSKNQHVDCAEIKVHVCDSYDSILEKLSKIYFPHGESTVGKLRFMEAALGNAKGELIHKDQFEAGTFRCDTQKRRIFLLTKTVSLLDDSEESTSVELPDLSPVTVRRPQKVWES